MGGGGKGREAPFLAAILCTPFIQLLARRTSTHGSNLVSVYYVFFPSFQVGKCLRIDGASWTANRSVCLFTKAPAMTYLQFTPADCSESLSNCDSFMLHRSHLQSRLYCTLIF